MPMALAWCPARVAGNSSEEQAGSAPRPALQRSMQFVRLAALVMQTVPRPGGFALSEGAALGGGRVGQLLRPGLQITPEQHRSKHHKHRNDADGNE